MMASKLSPAPKDRMFVLVGGACAGPPAHERGVAAHHPDLEADEGHRRLHVAEVGEAEQDPLAGVAGHQRGERLAVQVPVGRCARRRLQVPVGVARAGTTAKSPLLSPRAIDPFGRSVSG